MSRADLLNMPRIADKLAKLQAAHTDLEERMDRYHQEGLAQQGKETKHETRKPNHKLRRKQKDRAPKTRRETVSPSGSNGLQHEAGGEAHEGRGIQENEEVKDG